MSDAKVPLPTLQPDRPTTGGGYFVSNYPPFHYWSDRDNPRAISALAQPPQPDTPLGLYVHIPFCRKRCHFCYFKVYTDKNAAAIGRYLDAVIAEAHRYAESALVAGRPLKYVYFGGGTPSYLSAKQLEYLFDGLKDAFQWDGVEEVTFECEPGTLNENKLGAIQSLGVTRLSLGVENFDPHILEINNRAHNASAVDKAYQWARNVNFDQVNIDLIAGMLEETNENWQMNIDRTLALRPDCITIYQMEVPFNTTIYRRMKEDGKLTAPVADWATKRAWVGQAFEQFEKAGYDVSSAYTVVRDAERTKFVYRDALWNGADMVSLGVSSFGHLSGVHYQNEKDIEPYVEQVERGEMPIRRSLALNDDHRLIRQFVLQMKLGRVAMGPFRQQFGVDPLERFADQLAGLAERGLLKIEPDAIELSRVGLLRVDELLPAFFLPEHRTD